MEQYCEPNLPKGRVKRAFISSLLPASIISELNDLGVTTYKLGNSPNIKSELAYHPDILVNNYEKGLWVCESHAKYLPKILPVAGAFEESDEELGQLYPYDCLFNTFCLGKKLFCGKQASHTIRFNAEYTNKEICYVPQSYSKCTTVIVTEESVITSDCGMEKILRKNGIEVLLLADSAGIYLNGFSCGLLGGCSALIDSNLLVFTGNLNTYKYGDDIRDFCRDFGVDTLSLTNDDMYDYGGILPVTELVDIFE